jgi:hypothetical protein
MELIMSASLGDMFSFTGYVKATSKRSLSDCIYTLRENRSRAGWFGGYNIRLVLPKATKSQSEWRFEIEYYRQSHRSSRSSHMVQRLKGVMYQEGGQTHVVAKVNFTGAALRWLWLAVADACQPRPAALHRQAGHVYDDYVDCALAAGHRPGDVAR